MQLRSDEKRKQKEEKENDCLSSLCSHFKAKNSLIIKTMSPSPMLYLTSATIKKMLIPPNYQKQKE